MWGMALAVTALTAFVYLLVLLCARGTIRRNALAGIRVPSTLASDQAWLDGHRAALRPTAWGTAIAVVGLALSFVGGAVGVAGPAIALAGLLLAIVWGLTAASRAARSVARGR